MKRTYKGSGITRWAVDTYDPEEASDLVAIDRQLQHISQLGKVMDRIKRYEAMAAEVLSRNGLPTIDGRLYVPESDGAWSLVEEGETRLPQLSLLGLVAHCGFEEDTPVGYAARVISLSRFLAGALERGNADLTAQFGFELGRLSAESAFKFRWERVTLHGKAMRQPNRNLDPVNEDRKSEIALTAPLWKAEAKKIRSAHPKWSESAVIRQLRKNLNLPVSKPSDRTIARRLKEP